MSDVNLQAVREYLEKSGDDKDVQAYLGELRKITPEGAAAFLDSEEGRKMIQPRLDQHFSKGLETWKTKTLPSVLEDEIKKRFPGESESDKKLRQIQEDLAREREARIRESLRNRAITALTKDAMPVDLVELVVGTDEESTEVRLQIARKAWKEMLAAQVEERFKQGGRAPEQTGATPPDIDAEIRKAEAAKDWKLAIALKSKKAATSK